MGLIGSDVEANNNTFNFGLIVNSNQNNIDLHFDKELKFNGNLIKHIMNKWKLNKIKKYGKTEIELEQERTKYMRQLGEIKYYQTLYLHELDERTKAIPEENKKNPRISIVEPIINSLEYNIGEEQIREMFTNLLLSEMDSRKNQNITPAYIYIIQQLSMDDAKFLAQLKNYLSNKSKTIFTAISPLNLLDNNLNIHIVLNKNSKYKVIKINKYTIDNLKRLQFIEVTYTKDISNNDESISIIEKEDYNFDTSKSVYNKNIYMITDFGKNFINICCS